MDKDFKRIGITSYTACLVVYLCFAFIKADFNPFSWEEVTRFCAVLFALLGSVSGVLFYTPKD